MKIKQFPPKKRQLSLARRMKATEPYPPVPQRQRFAFGDWIDDGRLEYKRKFVCFNCRKMFRPPDSRSQWWKESCPDCKGPVTHVGMMFKTPRKNDKRSWKKLEEILIRKKS